MKAVGFLFDMDGVVCRNMPAHIEAWRGFFRKRGLEIELRDFLENTMGMPTRDVLAYYLKRPIGAAEARRLADEKEALYRELYAPRRRAAAGLRRFLGEARGAGHRVGLGTGSKKDNVSFLLDGLDLRGAFDAVVDSDAVKRGKPHPDTFLLLAERLKVLPRRCLVFEDSLLGEEAALRAGMRVVAITTSHRADEFRRAKLAVRDFRSLSVAAAADLVG